MSDFQSAEKDIQLLLDALKYNKKAFTPKTLSTHAKVPLNTTTAFISAMDKVPYLQLTKSPSGRLIRYRLNVFSPHIYYADAYCIIEKGRTTEGHYRSIRVMRAGLDTNILIADLLKHMGLVPEMVEKEIVEDLFLGFPLVKEKVQTLKMEQKQLEDEMAAEIQGNKDKKEWFEVEMRKARMGQRTKPEYRYVPTGTFTTVSKKVYVSYWFGDGQDEWESEEIPDTKCITTMVPDYPEKPEEVFEKQRSNPKAIQYLEFDIKEYETYPMKHEKILQAAKDRQAEVQSLEAKKRELDAQLRKLQRKY